ncbi:hypothetical protein V492_03406 [Pseudogymnoascus sp. VKM F-4246]|nr:hypothetical protein V492_03406 [Pseudogymnoascus sp. VKM F-4246]
MKGTTLRLKLYYVTSNPSICLQWDRNLYATTSTTLAISPISKTLPVSCQRRQRRQLAKQYPLYRPNTILKPPSHRACHEQASDHLDDLAQLNHAALRRKQDDPAQAGPTGRRRKWQDVVAKCLHARILPDGLRTDCLRELRPWYATLAQTLIIPILPANPVLPPDIFVDNVHIELSLWDTAGQEEFDRLRSLSYDDTHAIMLCFSVESKDSLENIESKWVGEIAENCPGVKLVLVALKCDLRENDDTADEAETLTTTIDGQPVRREKKECITYQQGLEVARRIGALRYLECSAMRNRGVNEAFTEAARVALSVKGVGGKDDAKCVVM